ncbi:hypothetical protein FB451DRAFT_1369502 [Mycena latifolia]|nr:hypothetical protein FB451DRAFT_1369502 [Mycena latifolia]
MSFYVCLFLPEHLDQPLGRARQGSAHWSAYTSAYWDPADLCLQGGLNAVTTFRSEEIERTEQLEAGGRPRWGTSRTYGSRYAEANTTKRRLGIQSLKRVVNLALGQQNVEKAPRLCNNESSGIFRPLCDSRSKPGAPAFGLDAAESGEFRILKEVVVEDKECTSEAIGFMADFLRIWIANCHMKMIGKIGRLRVCFPLHTSTRDIKNSDRRRRPAEATLREICFGQKKFESKGWENSNSIVPTREEKEMKIRQKVPGPY